jgi:small-conductance mechanosensitive channel
VSTDPQPILTTDPDSATALATERRIAWLTLAIGAVAALAAGLSYRWIWAAGLLIGAILAWLNFRWLRRGMDALVEAANAQAGATKTSVPIGTYFRALFRYGLIAFIVYVIFKFLGIPLVSMVLGLLALGAAAITASMYEVWHPVEIKRETQAVRGLK